MNPFFLDWFADSVENGRAVPGNYTVLDLTPHQNLGDA